MQGASRPVTATYNKNYKKQKGNNLHMRNKPLTKFLSNYILVVTEDGEYLLPDLKERLEAEGTELDTDINDSMTVRFLFYNEDTDIVEENWDLPDEYYNPEFYYGLDLSQLTLKQLVLYGYISKAESQDPQFIDDFIGPSRILVFIEDLEDILYN